MSRGWVLFLVLAAAACQSKRDPARFDLGAARRADTAPSFGPRRDAGHGITLEEVSFQSTEWSSSGETRPIRIRGALARPGWPGTRPAVLVAHGLGASAEPSVAVEVARNLDVVALALSAPGLGGSEGQGATFDDPRPIFATVPDVRGSWLYAYAFAILRGITVVQGLPEVEPGAVVLTGTSMGGIASLLANGADDRIGGVLAVSAGGGLEAGARAGSWFGTLVKAAGGLKLEDPSPQAFFRALDPLHHAGNQRGAVYLLSGAQDQFFPMDQVLRTFEALRAPARSLALVADYDHGWYFGTGCPARCMPGAPRRANDCPPGCPTTCPGRWPYCGPQASYNRQDDLVARWALLLRALVAQVARRPFAPPPPPPEVDRRGDEIVVRPQGPVAAVRLAVSDNGGFTYGQFRLVGTAGAYRMRVPAKAIVFAEVEGPEGAVTTSVPELPAGFVPPIRPFMLVPR